MSFDLSFQKAEVRLSLRRLKSSAMAAHISIHQCPCDEPGILKTSTDRITWVGYGTEQDAERFSSFVRGESTINVNGTHMKWSLGETCMVKYEPGDLDHVQVSHPVDPAMWHDGRALRWCNKCTNAGRDVFSERDRNILVRGS
jgi:hypothetical protein